MTPRNAIVILRQVEANWVANGQDHQNLIAAINVLEGVVAVAEKAQEQATPNAPAAPAEGQPESGNEPTGEQADTNS